MLLLSTTAVPQLYSFHNHIPAQGALAYHNQPPGNFNNFTKRQIMPITVTLEGDGGSSLKMFKL
jgi:hypothetical protein